MHYPTGQTQVRVSEFYIIETGTYNNIYHRPFRAHLTAEVESELYRTLNPLRPYTPSHFAGPATSFIKPDATPDGIVNIAGGWQAPRFRWVMKLDWSTPMRSRLVQVLTGYTDETATDLSYGLEISPNALFFINNSFIFRVDLINTPHGQIQQLSPLSGGQILLDPTYNGLMGRSIAMARPSDVVQVRALSQEPTFSALASDEMVIDGPTLTNEAKFSNRRNANPSTYISRILEGHRESFLKNKSYGFSNDNVIMDTMTATYDSTSTSDHFLNAIRNLNGHSIAGNSFTLNDLSQIDPNHRAKTVMVSSKSGIREHQLALARRHQAGESNEWSAATYLTQMAALIANAIPSIMADCAMQKVVLQSTNMAAGSHGRFLTTVASAHGFLKNLDMSEFIAQLIPRVETELLMALSYNGQAGVMVDISCELNGDTRVDLTIEGDHGCFVTPTFCDASYSPVIVGTFDRLNDIASMFHRVMENATEQYSGGMQAEPSILDSSGNTSSFDPNQFGARHYDDEYSHTDNGNRSSSGGVDELDSIL